LTTAPGDQWSCDATERVESNQVEFGL